MHGRLPHFISDNVSANPYKMRNFTPTNRTFQKKTNMEELKERILRDGKCLADGTLKVDSFINQQMDPMLLMSIATEFAHRFAEAGINKIITVEASGIAPAIMVGYRMGVPVVFAKKSVPATMENMLTTQVYSYTRKRNYDICVSRDFLHPGDRMLFIDDFLAGGNAAQGVRDLIAQAGAELCGMGFIIEKAFQQGGNRLRATGMRVESLAIIESLENGHIRFRS